MKSKSSLTPEDEKLLPLTKDQKNKFLRAVNLILKTMKEKRCVKITFNFHNGNLSEKFNIEYTDRL